MRRWVLLWFLGWFVIGFPWFGFSSSPHWESVGWTISVSLDRLNDELSNFLYYGPLGAFGIEWGWSLPAVAIAAALLSAGTELTQVFSTTRDPSMTDFAMNVTGAIAGCLVWGRWRRRRRR